MVSNVEVLVLTNDLQTILKQWGEDQKIDIDLGITGQDISRLHHKYLEMYTSNVLVLKKLENKLKRLWKIKWEYYLGFMTEDDLRKYELEPFQQKVLKTDVNVYIDADEDIIAARNKIAEHEQIVHALDSILKQLSNRQFLIKSLVDWEKFKVGG